MIVIAVAIIFPKFKFPVHIGSLLYMAVCCWPHLMKKITSELGEMKKNLAGMKIGRKRGESEGKINEEIVSKREELENGEKEEERKKRDLSFPLWQLFAFLGIVAVVKLNGNFTFIVQKF